MRVVSGYGNGGVVGLARTCSQEFQESYELQIEHAALLAVADGRC